MPGPLRFKFIEAFGFLCQETCIILYWMGLWSILQNFTPLLNRIEFNLFCLISGAVGVFVVKAIAPALILASIGHSSETFYKAFPHNHLGPTRRDVRYVKRTLLRQGAKVAR